MPNPPFLIVGLGNPGNEYAQTRHNFGFRVVDEIISLSSASSVNVRIQAEAWKGRLSGGPEMYILKPQTFMNLSGEAVAPFMRSKKLDADSLIVVHDDLDIPFGEIRVSRNASSGGHNGVQSIIDSLGTKDFTRVRLGIGRPPENVLADAFVLQRFKGEEEEKLPGIVYKTIAEIVKIFSR